MSKGRVAKASKVKPFIKTINYNHLMPTRYTLELEGLKTVISHETFKETSQREDAKKTVKKALEDRYTSGKNKWFFTPLSMCHFPSFKSQAYNLPTRILIAQNQAAVLLFHSILLLGPGSWCNTVCEPGRAGVHS